MTASRLRLLVAGLLFVAVVVAALTLPVPSPLQMRVWAQSAGVAAPVLFLLGHAVVTTTPIPRTVFTLTAGLLFGPVLGLALSLSATTLSAVLAFAVVRRLGRGLVTPHLERGMLGAVDARLGDRGWLAVASLRMIPAVPFSVLNYCSAVSSIRFRDYLVGTVGVVPGSVAVVALGDALTGRTSPALLGVSLGCAALGMVGLFIEARGGVRLTRCGMGPSARDSVREAPSKQGKGAQL
ncbi:MAG TPA: TVP38/TMEM64 family protein [Pseudonocardiaceae bacterium]